MAKRGSRARQAVGRGLVALMPRLLGALATIGTAAMLWVGGQIFLHGLDEFHIGGIGHALHDFAYRVAGGLPGRSEEHTSELQSLMRNSYAVFCLKKKSTKPQQKYKKNTYTVTI